MKNTVPLFSVFIEDSNILLLHSDNIDFVSNNESTKIEKFNSTEQLNEIIDYLENHNGETYILHDDDLEKLWAKFQDQYSLISAAGGLVTNTKNKILFIYRRKMWDLPKGKMEKDEAIEETAIREVQEECGLEQIILGDFLVKTYHTYKNRKGRRKLKTTYWYLMNSNDNPTPQVEEDIELCTYLTLEEFMSQSRKVYSTIWQVLDKYQLHINSK